MAVSAALAAVLVAALAIATPGVVAAPLLPGGSGGHPGVGSGSRHSTAAAQAGTVRRIVDGDTIDVRVGKTTFRVRLVQIDAPETRVGTECWGREATSALSRLLPTGTRVTLYADPSLGRTDRYGRALRYVFRGTSNVNVLMVARGDAAPYFYRGARGRYAAGLERVALAARRAGLGLWGACSSAVYDPDHTLDTGPAHA